MSHSLYHRGVRVRVSMYQRASTRDGGGGGGGGGPPAQSTVHVMRRVLRTSSGVVRAPDVAPAMLLLGQYLCLVCSAYNRERERAKERAVAPVILSSACQRVRVRAPDV